MICFFLQPPTKEKRNTLPCFSQFRNSQSEKTSQKKQRNKTKKRTQLHAGTAKAGIDAMTRFMANEWGRFNVRVNSVAPGPIDETLGFDKLGANKVCHFFLLLFLLINKMGHWKKIHFKKVDFYCKIKKQQKVWIKFLQTHCV